MANTTTTPLESAAATALLLGAVISGTGSVYEVSRVAQWQSMIGHRASIVIDNEREADAPADVRTAAEHLANIREIVNPAIADLAAGISVTRQAVYKWLSGDAQPEADKLEKIIALSRVADQFREAQVTRAPALLKMRLRDGKTLLTLALAGELDQALLDTLITEARAMEHAHAKAMEGVSQDSTTRSGSWQTELSIPGGIES